MKSALMNRTSAVVLAFTLVTTGCANMSQRDFYTGTGAALGAAAGMVLGGGRGANAGYVLGGAAAGAVVGRMLAPDCENKTTSNFNRQIYGNSESEWQGNQAYNEKCVGSGSQNIPGANLPRSTQTNGFFVR